MGFREIDEERAEKIMKSFKKEHTITTDDKSVFKIVSLKYFSVFAITEDEHIKKIYNESEDKHILLNQVLSYCRRTKTDLKDIRLINVEVFQDKKDKRENEGKANEENTAVIYIDMYYNKVIAHDKFLIIQEK